MAPTIRETPYFAANDALRGDQAGRSKNRRVELTLGRPGKLAGNLSVGFRGQIGKTSTFSEVTMFSKLLGLLNNKGRATAIDHVLAAALIAIAAVVTT